jgi:hypothetical protein
VLATEHRRPDPLAEFKRGKPALSDIAVYDQGTGGATAGGNQQGGTGAGAGTTQPGPGYGLLYPGSTGGPHGIAAMNSSSMGGLHSGVPEQQADTSSYAGVSSSGAAYPGIAGGVTAGRAQDMSEYGIAAAEAGEVQAALHSRSGPLQGTASTVGGPAIQQHPRSSQTAGENVQGMPAAASSGAGQSQQAQQPAPPPAHVVSGVMGLYVS